MAAIALHLYEQLTDAPDEKAKARAIAEAFGQLEERYPDFKDLATQGQVRESELRLQKEIKEVELRLQKEIEGVRLEIREVEGKLRKEIEGVRLEIRQVEVKIADTRAGLIRWVVGVGILQTTLLTGVLLKIAHLI
jgi:hypothetical protein